MLTRKQIWGGNLIFSGDKSPQMLAAVRNFTENYTDEKAGIIMTAEGRNWCMNYI